MDCSEINFHINLFYKSNIDMQPENFKPSENTFLHIQSLVYLVILAVIAVVFFIFQVFNESGEIFPLPKFSAVTIDSSLIAQDNKYTKDTDKFWVAPELESLKGSALESQILYGKDLIANTSKYLGPKGSVAQISSGMNCQNCHLDAGTKTFGNNYGSVSSTFPKFRARSGTEENIYKRVNDCFERSLNGQALDTMSTEMQAIKAYMLFLGQNVEKGVVVKGSGLKDLPFLDRSADPEKGKTIYKAKCESCHLVDGQGIKAADGVSYTYPPLWGKHSYNDAAGLYRLSNFAKYIKYNMPLGASYLAPQLSDEEAWDLAAFINSQLRPHKDTPEDWPDITKKPIDHPFGPYSDEFDAKQHKFGPFKPIVEARKLVKSK
jgi:thiosulfate dehydrogenase